jgi:hypothetical protein
MLRIYSMALLLFGWGPIADGGQDPPAREAPREQYPFFTDAENRLILDFYRPGSGHAPPGLAKRESPVPPVGQKPLARGGTLPVAMEKWAEPFPRDLDRRLRTVPEGYRRLLCGVMALLVQDSTRLIVDSLDLSRR